MTLEDMYEIYFKTPKGKAEFDAVMEMVEGRPDKSYIVKIQKGGIITIPKELRQKLNIKPGDIVDFKSGDGVIYIEFKRGGKMGKPRQIKKKKKELNGK
jgi:AbrB family looped-hinge helix DNA binding protein